MNYHKSNDYAELNEQPNVLDFNKPYLTHQWVAMTQIGLFSINSCLGYDI